MFTDLSVQPQPAQNNQPFFGSSAPMVAVFMLFLVALFANYLSMVMFYHSHGA